MKYRALIVFSLFGVLASFGALSASAVGAPCEAIFETSPGEISDSDNLISYLEKLTEEQIIRAPEITRFRDALAEGKLANPIFKEDTATKTTSMIHAKALDSLLANGDFDLAKLLAWSESALKDKERVKDRRDETRAETKEDIYHKIEFRNVPAGEFKMGEDGEKVKIVLTHPLR